MGAVLALLSSLTWGSSDFTGGTLSRRLHPLAVIRASTGIALLGLVVIAAAGGSFADSGYLVWGVTAGLAGLLGLSCFYAALAAGTMGVVAPIAATGAAVPVAVGLLQGESPAPAQLAGIVVTVVGVILASGPERDADAAGLATHRRTLLLAAVAAVSFGTVFTLVAEGGKHSIVMTLLTMRVVNLVISSVILALVVGKHLGPTRADLPRIVFISAADAGANGLYAVATTIGLVSVTAVLASLYPAVTTLLAWRVHGERLRSVQVTGVVAILAGVALIAAGSA